jgi:hypothetical protein
MAITGITFDNQGPTATSDAVFHENIFTDGVLRGCEVSFVGAQITIAPGYLISAGRLCAFQSAETVNVPAQLGVARVVLQTNLGGASSAGAFDQLSLLVQTASTVSGLPALVQEDINGGGLIYQQMLCIANVSSSGVTSIAQTAPAAALILPALQIQDSSAENTGAAAKLGGDGTISLKLPSTVRANFYVNTMLASSELVGSSYPTSPKEGQIFLLIE